MMLGLIISLGVTGLVSDAILGFLSAAMALFGALNLGILVA